MLEDESSDELGILLDPSEEAIKGYIHPSPPPPPPPYIDEMDSNSDKDSE
jgi:hypothetical protein